MGNISSVSDGRTFPSVTNRRTIFSGVSDRRTICPSATDGRTIFPSVSDGCTIFPSVMTGQQNFPVSVTLDNILSASWWKDVTDERILSVSDERIFYFRLFITDGRGQYAGVFPSVRGGRGGHYFRVLVTGGQYFRVLVTAEQYFLVLETGEPYFRVSVMGNNISQC